MTSSPFITCGETRLLNLPHAEAVIREIWEEDCYRLNEIPDGSIVFDVGAFYGEFGLICAVNKNCHVWAFEPAPPNFEICELNRLANHYRKHFVSSRIAVSGKRQSISVFYRPEHPAGSLLTEIRHSITAPVECTTLSSAVESAIIAFGEFPITVKLDCEGEEYRIFKDDPGWIDHVQIVTMEWHNYDGDFYAYILEKHGFDVELSGGGPKPRPAWDRSMGGGLLFAKRRSQ